MRPQWKFLTGAGPGSGPGACGLALKVFGKLELEFYPDGVVTSPRSLMLTALMFHVACPPL